MERFVGVRRQAEARAISDAMCKSGIRVVEAADGTEAPLVYRVEMPDGQALRIVCYAFLANKYRQEGRPADEHRFQIKYGDLKPVYHC